MQRASAFPLPHASTRNTFFQFIIRPGCGRHPADASIPFASEPLIDDTAKIDPSGGDGIDFTWRRFLLDTVEYRG